jgi:membrane-associated phospholipid phosphatase
MSSRASPRAWLGEADRIDRALYQAVASTPTPLLDRATSRISRAADHSKLSIAASLVMAIWGGRRGREAAARGLASVAVTSAVVNLLIKPLGRRHRPERDDVSAAPARQVAMPASRSFPSGHTAAAVAFATAAGHVAPVAAAPLRVLAALVGYSRVHTGVHYPGDVVAGALIGAVIADLVSPAVGRIWERHSASMS